MSDMSAQNEWSEEAFFAMLWQWFRTHTCEIKYVENPHGGRVKILDGTGFKPADWDHYVGQLMLRSEIDKEKTNKVVDPAVVSDPLEQLARMAVLVPTHQHLLSKSDYYKLGTASVQTSLPLNDYDKVIVYISHDKNLYVRRKEEFEEKFVSLPAKEITQNPAEEK